MFNAIFIIWRECFEAVLIVGILFTYLKRQSDFEHSRKFLWSGVAAGAALSGILAWGIQHAETELQGKALDSFQIALLFIAAVLMTQMCVWMKRHSRTIKSELEKGLSDALSTKHLIGVAFLAMLAVSREGAEIVIFLFGMGVESPNSLLGAGLAGLFLTFLTAFAFYRGLKIFNPKIFFRVTTVFLFLTASNLILMATRKLIQADFLPPLRDGVWDTSFMLDERSSFGQVASAITGYQANPPLMLVLVGTVYWVVSLWFFFREPNGSPVPASPRTATPV